MLKYFKQSIKLHILFVFNLASFSDLLLERLQNFLWNIKSVPNFSNKALVWVILGNRAVKPQDAALDVHPDVDACGALFGQHLGDKRQGFNFLNFLFCLLYLR